MLTGTLSSTQLGFSQTDLTVPHVSPITLWAADYTGLSSGTLGNVTVTAYPTAGLATMGGGNLSVRTRGDFLAQAGTFGQGNLSIYAGGNISGRFLNYDGTGKIHTAGNFGSNTENPTIELGNSQTTVTAAGDIYLGTVLNPTLLSVYCRILQIGTSRILRIQVLNLRLVAI